MRDKVFRSFLQRELSEAQRLAAASDILTVVPMEPPPAQRFLAEFRCQGLVRQGEAIVPWDRFAVGICFPDDHLRRPESAAMISLLAPKGCWHPNVRFPLICPGGMPAGSGLVDLLFQVYEILSYQRYSLRDPLSPEAARWGRSHMHLFPTDPRPLKWKAGRAENGNPPSPRTPSESFREPRSDPSRPTRPGDPETPSREQEATE